MSSPDDNERSDDDYAPKWTRDNYRQGSPDSAKAQRPLSERELTHLRRSLDPETVDFSQPSPRRLGWLTAGGFIIAAALGAVIGLLATGELRSIFGNAPGSSTKTIELTSRSDNSKMPEQVSSPTDRLAIAPTAPQATQPSSPTVSLPIAPTVAQPAKKAPARLATVGGASEPAPTVRGVTDSEIRFGISAPFTGPAKELGQNMKLGIEAAFNAANANGGVYGRQL
jgi:branched-chain amino acid transport system substrate-binding protein